MSKGKFYGGLIVGCFLASWAAPYSPMHPWLSLMAAILGSAVWLLVWMCLTGGPER